MKRIGFGYFVSGLDCFYDAPDAGGGGGSDTSFQGDSGGGDPSPAAEPTVYEVSDDSLIKLPGQEKPVKFGEHTRGFQSQFTKASQEAARLKRELEQRDQKLRQYEAQQQQFQRQQQGQGQNRPRLSDQLRGMNYLDGEAAATMAEAFEGEIRQRDQILLAALQKVAAMEKTLNTLNESHVGASFEGKINKWLGEIGLPPEAADLAKEVYLAYEGDDLDYEFPQILRNRWEQLQRVFAATQQQKIQAAKKQPFLPGRGGGTGPSRPLQLDPRLSAAEVADQLWPMFAEGNET